MREVMLELDDDRERAPKVGDLVLKEAALKGEDAVQHRREAVEAQERRKAQGKRGDHHRAQEAHVADPATTTFQAGVSPEQARHAGVRLARAGVRRTTPGLVVYRLGQVRKRCSDSPRR